MVTEEILNHPEMAGIHYTGSTQVFRDLWKTVGGNIHKYKNYPRIVGETGGKDYIFAHPSAKVDALSTAMVRGAFEYQGQKCSAASRAFIPSSIWPEVKQRCTEQMSRMKVSTAITMLCKLFTFEGWKPRERRNNGWRCYSSRSF